MPASLASLSDEFIIPLTGLTCISVTGEQRDSYLHGQLTVNTNDLKDDQVRFTAHCDNKGKTWALGEVVRHGDAVLLLLNSDAAQHCLAQLNKYGVFSKVDIAQDKQYSQFLISDSLAAEVCDALFAEKKPAADKLLVNDSGLAYQTSLRHAWRLVLKPEAAEQLQALLKSRAESVVTYEHNVFDALAIEAGIPDVSGPVINEYVPQMMNVQALNGIDFDKGCYMGQEVIARTRFLGKNKRAAFIFTLPQAVCVKVGDTLEKQLGENWRRGGKVIRCATLGESTYLMAVLANDTSEGDCHRLADNPDVTMTPDALPYSIEQELRRPPGKPNASR